MTLYKSVAASVAMTAYVEILLLIGECKVFKHLLRKRKSILAAAMHTSGMNINRTPSQASPVVKSKAVTWVAAKTRMAAPHFMICL